LVAAAPVGSRAGEEAAVRDEALQLLTAEEEPAVESPVTAAPPPAEAPPPPLVQARPPAPPAAGGRIRRRPRLRRPSFGRDPFGPSRTAMLLRGFMKLVAVVVAAGAVGVLLGIGMAKLTGDGDASTPSAAEMVRVVVRQATARPPANGAEQGSRVTVRATVENASGRAIRLPPPTLLVDDLRLAVATGSGGTGGELLVPSLADGAVAEGTLRFDVPSMSPGDLGAARVGLRLAGKIVMVEPMLGESAAG
jgi:hypothetical protein